MQEFANFINGRLVPASGGRTLDVFEPATGEVYARVADSNRTDVEQAVEAATAAFGGWSTTPAAERSKALLRLADLIERNTDALAEAESRDTGKPVSLARAVDIPRSAANFRFFAGAVLHTTGEWFETETPAPSAGTAAVGGSAINYTLRRPRGVAGLISPWNLPLYLLSWKIAPALATGNTAVCKPSEITPATATLLAMLSVEAGLPPGVLNIVHGQGGVAGGALVQHPAVPTLSFTGSTAVGRWIGRHAGESLKRVSLELGGKNPFVVFADADIEATADEALRAGFANQGQVCLCGSRILVERPVYDRFLGRLIEKVGALSLGDPREAGTRQGALTSAAHLAKVAKAVESARESGATIHCGGARPDPKSLPERCRRGYFYLPTVMSGLAADCGVEQEEIFGPVVSVSPFDDEDAAVASANATPYGLAASLWTRDLSRAHRVASRLEAGIVWVNCWMLRDLRTPFGGVKQSGVGREGGAEALRFFTEPKNICIRV